MLIKTIICLLLATCCFVTGPALADGREQPVGTGSVRSRINLPSILDFSRFQVLFNKHYSSIVEELRRQKLFLVKTFKVFMHNLKFKRGERDTYLKLNSMSDLTTDEVHRMYMRPDRHRDISIKTEEAPVSRSTKRLRRNIEPTDLNSVEDENDQIFVDHRKSKCLSPVKNQGNCASCFIFTVTALFEWHHCELSGQLELFSEQYAVDCSHRYGMNGCGGGPLPRMVEFYKNCGLELHSRYPYRATVMGCPYSDETNENEMGYSRLEEVRVRQVARGQLDVELIKAPVMVGFYVNKDFVDYGGGIDSNDGCDMNSAHAMLLVGSDQENGIHYWILKNSFSSSWGEAGYYRISKATKCLIETESFIIEQESLSSIKANPLYNENVLKGNSVDYNDESKLNQIWFTMN